MKSFKSQARITKIEGFQNYLKLIRDRVNWDNNNQWKFFFFLTSAKILILCSWQRWIRHISEIKGIILFMECLRVSLKRRTFLGVGEGTFLNKLAGDKSWDNKESAQVGFPEWGLGRHLAAGGKKGKEDRGRGRLAGNSGLGGRKFAVFCLRIFSWKPSNLWQIIN